MLRCPKNPNTYVFFILIPNKKIHLPIFRNFIFSFQNRCQIFNYFHIRIHINSRIFIHKMYSHIIRNIRPKLSFITFTKKSIFRKVFFHIKIFLIYLYYFKIRQIFLPRFHTFIKNIWLFGVSNPDIIYFFFYHYFLLFFTFFHNHHILFHRIFSNIHNFKSNFLIQFLCPRIIIEHI